MKELSPNVSVFVASLRLYTAAFQRAVDFTKAAAFDTAHKAIEECHGAIAAMVKSTKKATPEEARFMSAVFNELGSLKKKPTARP